MPKSKRPRKKGGPRSPESWLNESRVQQMAALEATMASPEPLKLDPNPPRSTAPRRPSAPRRTTPVHKPSPAPVHAARASRSLRRYGVPIAAGAAGLGGAAYLMHRRRRSNVGKGLIDPMTGDRVVFEKRYIGDEYDDAPMIEFGKAGVFIPGGILTNLSTGSGRTREGQGVSHANRVHHTRNRGASARDGRLHRIKHGGRSRSGSSVGKMFSETGHGVGRRLLEV